MHENTYHKYDTKFLEFIDNLDTQYEVILFSNLYVFKNKKTYHYNENQFQSNFGLAKYIREKLKI